MKKIVVIVEWILCAILVIGGISSPGLQTLFLFAAAILVCPLFRNRVKLPKKIWIPMVVILFLVGVFLSPRSEQSSLSSNKDSSTMRVESSPTESAPEIQITPELISDSISQVESEPDIAQSASGDEDSKVVANGYTVQLGGSSFVTIQRHPVMNGNRTEVLFDIGIGETSTEIMSTLSSDELSAFIAALDFDNYGYGNIVLSFEDGTGIVFQKGSSSFTNDYGVVDVGPGNFEMTERLGAIWNEGEGWYYMTVAEMAAEDAANG